MNSRNEILTELEELDSPLANLSRDLPYRIPEDYFESLAARLSAKTLIETAAAAKAIPFAVPDGYLENLPEALLQAVRNAETPAQANRTISLAPLWKRHLTRIAAAAILILAVSIGTYTYVQHAPAERRLSRQLEALDRATIDEYLQQHADELETESLEAALLATNADPAIGLSELSAAEIDGYLQDEAGIDDSETIN